jgi:hypothetical protein
MAQSGIAFTRVGRQGPRTRTVHRRHPSSIDRPPPPLPPHSFTPPSSPLNPFYNPPSRCPPPLPHAPRESRCGGEEADDDDISRRLKARLVIELPQQERRGGGTGRAGQQPRHRQHHADQVPPHREVAQQGERRLRDQEVEVTSQKDSIGVGFIELEGAVGSAGSYASLPS